ncbi:12562_t:CDS:2, partial [Dentiscutata heterogama]
WDRMYSSILLVCWSLHPKLANDRASKLSCIHWHMIQDENIQNIKPKNFQSNELFENDNEFYTSEEQLETLRRL